MCSKEPGAVEGTSVRCGSATTGVDVTRAASDKSLASTSATHRFPDTTKGRFCRNQHRARPLGVVKEGGTPPQRRRWCGELFRTFQGIDHVMEHCATSQWWRSIDLDTRVGNTRGRKQSARLRHNMWAVAELSSALGLMLCSLLQVWCGNSIPS